MFLTRSIRRKLCLGLGCVLVMLCLLAGSGLVGLLSYRNVINDLENNIKFAPRRYDLVVAASQMVEPLLNRDAPTFEQRIGEMKKDVLEFRHKLERMPQSPANNARRPVIDSLLGQIDFEVARLEEQAALLRQPTIDPFALLDMTYKISRIQTASRNIPNPIEGLDVLWAESRTVYRWCFTVVCVSGGLTLACLLWLIGFAYLWIFRPIKALHRGAALVAHGDYTVRVHLKGRDEIVDLANTFNKMTERFQEVKTDLDRQVMERSRQLVRSERLANVGFLAAGVAHEINNPLSAISMAAESLSSRAYDYDGNPVSFKDEDQPVFLQYLTMIQQESQRCQQITSRLLDFARGQDAPRSKHDLNRIVNDVIQMVGHMSRFRGHKIEFQAEKSVNLEINGAEIKQVILNLVANGLESMDKPGVLKIQLQEQADSVQLTFTDNGCGMAPHVLENLFEPFFTEKKSGKGTGLGLSISHRIVTEHGGQIEPASEGPGKGSTFRVRLPRRAPARPSVAA